MRSISMSLGGILALLVPTLVLGAADSSQDSKSIDVTLAAGKLHEECLHIAPGEKRRYHWKSDAPVDFNIHYHKQTEIFYPVKRDGMRGDGGTFRAKTGEDYCWMWTARDKPAKITGKIEAK